MTSERRLMLRLCTDVGPAGETVRPFVMCPRKATTVHAHTCAGCLRMRSIEWSPLEGGEVRCLVGEETRPVDPRADFAERAARAEVFDLIGPVATCVTPDLQVKDVRERFERAGTATLPVVDDGARLVGIVRLADLDGGATVREVMTATDRMLPEQAPISAAISLFAFGDLTPVPVVKLDGTVVGVCEPKDALRWVAGELGLVAPTE